MTTIDKLLVIHLIVEAFFSVFYLLWQSDHIRASDKAIQLCITVLNIFETILLVLTRFTGFGPYGSFALGAWYVLNTALLVMQLVFADWGVLYKIETVLWIVFYIFMFFLDILHMNLLTMLIQKYGVGFMQFGEAIKGTYWGDILKSIIIVIVKFICNIFVTAKSKN